ncbi:sensor histidine kinase [Caproiciproducens sp. NJN-50]|uniref:ATP-binding protein n=2 Tax=Acutalibacteraceae TaxID=3082771 RepID=UPI000FFE0CE4|nr:sensor histidine kinase [Caproiciproducens sp. NJN-50]QAT50549.1 sensor histidine kinase [Caproiciproducens sp. NJN-50]
MVHWNRRGRKDKGLASMFAQLFSLSTLVWIVLLSVTLTVTLHFSLSSLQEKIESGLVSTASSLADSEAVKDALQKGTCPKSLTDYLDDLISKTEDLDIVTIADAHSTRLYHVVHARVGEQFVGGDENRALAGESYVVNGVGTMGPQRRFFCPVKNGDGKVIGFVMTSTTMDRIQSLRNRITMTYLKLAAFLMLATLILAGSATFLIRHLLLGYSPEELVHTYLTQNEVLNNLDEGVVFVDAPGKIQLVNRAAEGMLGQRSELLEGAVLDSLIQEESGESLLREKEEKKKNISTSRPNILSCCIPLRKNERRSGTLLILSDRTEAMRTAEQLNGTRHIVSALRANSHEFMNKLQVIAGLLQMGRQKEALSYIGSISALQAKVIGPVLQYIRNSSVAALLLGKLNNMRELDISLTLLANSDLPEHSRYLSTSDLVTVVGNLLENSIEAVNAQRGDGPRSIVLQITEDEDGLLILVTDTGTGIEPENLSRIYEPGFSTKAAQGRGVGMSLVNEIVGRREGSIEVDSEPMAGTTFTLIFNRKRQRK